MLRRQVRVLHLPIVDHLSPVLVLAFQLVAEMYLLRHNQAQRRVVDRRGCGLRDGSRMPFETS